MACMIQLYDRLLSGYSLREVSGSSLLFATIFFAPSDHVREGPVGLLMVGVLIVELLIRVAPRRDEYCS